MSMFANPLPERRCAQHAENLLSPKRTEIIHRVAEEFRFLEDFRTGALGKLGRLITSGRVSAPVPQSVHYTRLGEGKYSESVIPIEDPGLVIKFFRSRWRRMDGPGNHPLNDLGEALEHLALLKQTMNDRIPPTEITEISIRGTRQVVAIQERIEGANLKTAEPSDALKAELAAFLENAFNIFKDNLQHVEGDSLQHSILVDIQPDNLIYGKPWGSNAKERLLHVDTYPVEASSWVYLLDRYLPDRKVRFDVDYFRIFDWLRSKALVELRSKLSPGEFKEGCSHLPAYLVAQSLSGER